VLTIESRGHVSSVTHAALLFALLGQRLHSIGVFSQHRPASIVQQRAVKIMYWRPWRPMHFTVYILVWTSSQLQRYVESTMRTVRTIGKTT
jgi:hypothetical protein